MKKVMLILMCLAITGCNANKQQVKDNEIANIVGAVMNRNVNENDIATTTNTNDDNSVDTSSNNDEKVNESTITQSSSSSTNKGNTSSGSSSKTSTSSTSKGSTSSSSGSSSSSSSSSTNKGNTSSGSSSSSSSSGSNSSSSTEKTFAMTKDEIIAYGKSYILSKGFDYDTSGTGYNAPLWIEKGESKSTIKAHLKEHIDCTIDELNPEQYAVGIKVITVDEHWEVIVKY